MRRLLLVLVGVLGVPASVACSVAVSTSGLAGPPLEPVQDADAALEGAPPSEAGAADAGSYCERQRDASFCADFDGVDDVTMGFSGTSTASTDYGYAASKDSVSAPRALDAHVGSSVNAENQASARLYHELPFIARTVHVELDAKLCDVGDHYLEFLKVETSSADLHGESIGFEGADVSLGTAGGNSALSVEYYTGNGGTGGSGGQVVDPPFPVGKWFHVALDIAFTRDPAGSVRLVVDRAATPAVDLQNVRTLSSSPSAMRVLVGTYTSGAPAACSTLIDNLLIAAAP